MGDPDWMVQFQSVISVAKETERLKCGLELEKLKAKINPGCDCTHCENWVEELDYLIKGWGEQ